MPPCQLTDPNRLYAASRITARDVPPVVPWLFRKVECSGARRGDFILLFAGPMKKPNRFGRVSLYKCPNPVGTVEIPVQYSVQTDQPNMRAVSSE